MAHRKSDRDRREQLKTVAIILAFFIIIADKVELQGLIAEMERQLNSLQTTMSKVSTMVRVNIYEYEYPLMIKSISSFTPLSS